MKIKSKTLNKFVIYLYYGRGRYPGDFTPLEGIIIVLVAGILAYMLNAFIKNSS